MAASRRNLDTRLGHASGVQQHLWFGPPVHGDMATSRPAGRAAQSHVRWSGLSSRPCGEGVTTKTRVACARYHVCVATYCQGCAHTECTLARIEARGNDMCTPPHTCAHAPCHVCLMGGMCAPLRKKYNCIHSILCEAQRLVLRPCPWSNGPLPHLVATLPAPITPHADEAEQMPRACTFFP